MVDVQYYTTDSLFEVFAAVAKIYFTIIGMVFYGRRIATYNNATTACVEVNGFNTYDPLEINDVFWFFIFMASVPIQFYRMAFGLINTAIYFPLG